MYTDRIDIYLAPKNADFGTILQGPVFTMPWWHEQAELEDGEVLLVLDFVFSIKKLP